MKKVVIACADFVPSSYPPSLRVRFFANHLKDLGWEPVIITIEGDSYEWSCDPEMNELLDDDLEVIRVKPVPTRLSRALRVGDIGLRSFWAMWRALKRYCREQQPDLVFLPLPPFYTAILGNWLHRKFGVPYVMDYIDPWVSDYWKREPDARRLSKRGAADFLARRLEPVALRRVSHLIGVSKGTTDDVIQRYPFLEGIGATAIPYGGETLDFEYVRRTERPCSLFDPDDGDIHFSYIGRAGFDMRPALKAIFEGFRQAKERSPERYARVRFHFIGTSYASGDKGERQVLPIAEEAGVADVVEEWPERVSYLEALRALCSSHCLVVCGSDAPHYTASKIFPYILSDRPLLAVFHDQSSAVPILRETSDAEVFTFPEASALKESAERIAKSFDVLMDSIKKGNGFDPSAFQRYTTQAMTQKLATAFDAVIGESPSRE